ncbi:MAG: tRNA (guanine(10)-N(2))-dimethyltransferase [Halobacteria archaeon]
MLKEGKVEFDDDDVFYNDRMVMNRDVTVAVAEAWSEGGAETYVDGMSASGIRGMRIAKETGLEPVLNDRSENAVEKIRENLELNDLDSSVERSDANVLFHRERFDVVDVDPFGSPIPFADSAFQATRSLACFTATDTAPLCGAHDSSLRRYFSRPLNTTYHPEMGLRTLVGSLARTAARYDIAVEPVLSHASDHYHRTYLKVESGAKKSDATLENLGSVRHCRNCGYRDSSEDLYASNIECPNCGEETDTAGPLWLAELRDREFTAEVRSNLREYMDTYRRAWKMLNHLEGELDTPTHYDHHMICRRAGTNPTKLQDFLEQLRKKGYNASKTHYSGTSFKTNADITDLTEIVLE